MGQERGESPDDYWVVGTTNARDESGVLTLIRKALVCWVEARGTMLSVQRRV